MIPLIILLKPLDRFIFQLNPFSLLKKASDNDKKSYCSSSQNYRPISILSAFSKMFTNCFIKGKEEFSLFELNFFSVIEPTL